MVVDWWQSKIVFPFRRVWVSVSARFKSRNRGAGLLKLRDDIQTCGYEDVRVMWEMLSRTEPELVTKTYKHRSLWRYFVWSNNSAAAPFSANAH